MGEYQSPFQLPPPDTVKCSDRYAAQKFPLTHARSLYGRCPYHFDRPDRRHRIPPEIDTHWQEWAKWREEYAKPSIPGEARDQAMQAMLSYVTETNPPEVASKTYPVKRTKTKTWHDIDGRPHSYEVARRPSDGKLVLVSVTAVILAACMFVCFLAILLL